VYRAAPWNSECADALTVRKLWAGSVIVVGGVVCWACCW